MPALLSTCENHCIRRMDSETVVDMLLAADTCMGAVRLKKAAIQFIISKVKQGELSITHKKFRRLPKLVFAEIAEAVLKTEDSKKQLKRESILEHMDAEEQL